MENLPVLQPAPGGAAPARPAGGAGGASSAFPPHGAGPAGTPEFGGRRPEWLKVRLPAGPTYSRLKDLIRSENLHTVCEEAHCPNIGECWTAGTATFMILGDTCTRACTFCAVKTGRPTWFDDDEPRRVAESIAKLDLVHAVITAVDRDDLPDGGALIFAETIRQTRALSPNTSIEVLVGDFQGDWDALATVMAARPEILNHNVETVGRLYRTVRPKAVLAHSLELLRRARELDPGTQTKTGFMVGLGETREEITELMGRIREAEVEILTIGQYLRPSLKHHDLVRYYSPDEFAALKDEALAMGFRWVESGPLVRSSYHAERQVDRDRLVGRLRSA
ncbi:MAG TPA: lipoyl synthase [Candidatus Dormibacteraeota bacterium]|nr:lipoyl synthase [Candidatus Dormibacteraeota bacterium]